MLTRLTWLPSNPGLKCACLQNLCCSRPTPFPSGPMMQQRYPKSTSTWAGQRMGELEPK